MRFLGRFLLALALICCAYIAPLRAVNPEGDFRSGLFAPIVVDAREWKMDQLRSSADVRGYDALVLGSSRSMQLGRDFDPRYGTHAYNFAVDSAHVEDYVAIYHWAKQMGIRPRVLAVGIDLEALHDADRVDERYERNPELIGALGETPDWRRGLDAFGTEIQKYKRMFTTWYVRDAVQSARVHLSSAAPPEIEALEADGLLRYPRWDAQRIAGTFDLKAETASCLPLYVDRFRDMNGLSAWRASLLEQLFKEAALDGVLVIAWLTPLHAETIAQLSARTAYATLRERAVTLLADLSTRYGVRWRDLSDPASFAATDEGWYDCAHLDASNLARLIAALPK